MIKYGLKKIHKIQVKLLQINGLYLPKFERDCLSGFILIFYSSTAISCLPKRWHLNCLSKNHGFQVTFLQQELMHNRDHFIRSGMYKTLKPRL